MAHSVKLRDYLIPNPATVKPGDSVLDAMQIIINNKISGVCVVDDQHNLVGILSELDCLNASLGSLYNDSGIGLVRDHMADSGLIVAHPEEDIIDVAQDMLAKTKRRRPVVENGRLIGQVTCRQLLKAIAQFQR
ncbi:protein-inosine monophosphate dehydrogenase [Halioglobus japonicus]|uniref:CBS domain-containing protein n=1 Tax=Halioglobus japonicus TaxID=930805 RepID=A0AAP8SLU4_9GAMM|nr:MULTISPECIES: CBS domain-containing protein [Halioglobus]AQA16982.1 protein-inosine monophosphate dehydrogenase [Halioglobus japonicus]KZX58554.1 protein-inosine monophosphate dehydrogenase [Halioglobus sp. HI00S01]PLW84869.1 CBS domain-containing protein [Halioglobus japonicus]GHD21865.1 membrane protein [Halioglobus japonicus]